MKIETEPASSKEIKSCRLVWCSLGSNLVSTYNSQSPELSETIQGAQLRDEFQSAQTLIQQMPGMDYLVSTVSRGYNSKFEIFDLSKKNKMLYSSGEMQGSLNTVTCSEKAQLMALLSTRGKAAYSIFDFNRFEIVKRAKWQSFYQRGVSAFDINSDGDRMVVTDGNGSCSLLDVATDDSLFYLKLGEKVMSCRCRWNPKKPLIAISFDGNKLNFVDAEKETTILNRHLQLHSDTIWWIDWRNDCNLIATCSMDESIKVYDLRQNYIVSTFKNHHHHNIATVRWSPCGSILASASWDTNIKLTDFSTGLTLYKAKTADESNRF